MFILKGSGVALLGKMEDSGGHVERYLFASFGLVCIQEFLKCGDLKIESLWKTDIH